MSMGTCVKLPLGPRGRPKVFRHRFLFCLQRAPTSRRPTVSACEKAAAQYVDKAHSRSVRRRSCEIANVLLNRSKNSAGSQLQVSQRRSLALLHKVAPTLPLLTHPRFTSNISLFTMFLKIPSAHREIFLVGTLTVLRTRERKDVPCLPRWSREALVDRSPNTRCKYTPLLK